MLDAQFTSIKNSSQEIHFKYFSIVLTIFSATWLISNIAAVKITSIFGIIFTGGFIIFPFTSMLNLTIVEVYGYKNSRQATWSGFMINLLYIVFIDIVNILPASPHWHLEEQFNNILASQNRIVAASIISFVLFDFVNSYLMAKMKLKSKGRSLYKRLVISSVIAMLIDTLVFILLAFYKTIPDETLMQLLFTAYSKKIFCHLFLLPVTYCLIERLKNLERIDVYDYDTKFNPFSLDNIYVLPLVQKI